MRRATPPSVFYSYSMAKGALPLPNDKTTIDLRPREQKFCEAYLQTGKKEESAIQAGYSPKSAAVAASRLLKKDNVLAYIRALQARAREELHIDDNWAVLRAIEVYNRCMQAKPVMEWSYKEHKMVATGEYCFDSKGALEALKLIKSLLGLGEADDEKVKVAITFVDDLTGEKIG